MSDLDPLGFLVENRLCRCVLLKRCLLWFRHTISLLLLLPSKREWRSWQLARGSREWARYDEEPGMTPAGRCILDVAPLSSDLLAALAESCEGVDGAASHRLQQDSIRQLQAMLGEGRCLYRVRFFTDSLSRIDRHAWPFTVIVDPDENEIISCRAGLVL